MPVQEWVDLDEKSQGYRLFKRYLESWSDTFDQKNFLHLSVEVGEGKAEEEDDRKYTPSSVFLKPVKDGEVRELQPISRLDVKSSEGETRKNHFLNRKQNPTDSHSPRILLVIAENKTQQLLRITIAEIHLLLIIQIQITHDIHLRPTPIDLRETQRKLRHHILRAMRIAVRAINNTINRSAH